MTSRLPEEPLDYGELAERYTAKAAELMDVMLETYYDKDPEGFTRQLFAIVRVANLAAEMLPVREVRIDVGCTVIGVGAVLAAINKRKAGGT